MLKTAELLDKERFRAWLKQGQRDAFLAFSEFQLQHRSYLIPSFNTHPYRFQHSQVNSNPFLLKGLELAGQSLFRWQLALCLQWKVQRWPDERRQNLWSPRVYGYRRHSRLLNQVAMNVTHLLSHRKWCCNTLLTLLFLNDTYNFFHTTLNQLVLSCFADVGSIFSWCFQLFL